MKIKNLGRFACRGFGKRTTSRSLHVQKASLAGVRVAGPRHSYAGGALVLGEGLPMIGKLLGHAQAQTTARYAQLAGDP